jgi:hypothetical protein
MSIQGRSMKKERAWQRQALSIVDTSLPHRIIP